MGSWAAAVAEAAHNASSGHRKVVMTDAQRLPATGFSGMLVLGSRGAGKTMSGMHWLNDRCLAEPGLRARVIAPTLADGIASCVEGVDGLRELSGHKATFSPSAPGGSVVTYPNGSHVWIVGTPTANDVDRLRALTNIEIDVWEEAAANRMLAATVTQAALSRRRGNPRWVALTTPRPTDQIRKWIADESIPKIRLRMEDNPSLPQVYRDYAEDLRINNPRMYRQEILAEVVDDIEGALWTWTDIERSVVDEAPEMVKVVVGVDPAVGRGTTGIVVAGVTAEGVVYVLEDASLTDVSPATWALKVATVFAKWDASLVVAEDNQGGRLVPANLKAAELSLPVKTVNARLSKEARAVPVAALWEADDQRAKMLRGMTKMTTQMCFPAGTLVACERGAVPIESVTTEDRVWTRYGLAPLKWAGQSGVADELTRVTHSGGVLECTAWHPILNAQTGEFVPANAVRVGDPLLMGQPEVNTACVCGGRSDGGTACDLGTTEASGTASQHSSTGRSGSTIMDSPIPIDSCITSTTTPETTGLKISGKSPRKSMRPSILRNTRSYEDSLLPSGAMPRNVCGANGPGTSGLVSNAERCFTQGKCELWSAGNLAAVPEATVVSARPAYVESVTTRSVERIPVYDLSVADGYAHEFFADGILVHNCEWVPGVSTYSPDRIDAMGHAVAELRGNKHGLVEIQHGVAPVTSLAGFRQQRLGA